MRPSTPPVAQRHARGAARRCAWSWVITHDRRAGARAAREQRRGSRRRCGSRGCRSARRPARSPARRRWPGRWRPAGARRRTARPAGGRMRCAEADPLERAAAPAPGARPQRHAAVEQAGGHVVERGQPVEQVELLEHEADAPAPQRRQLAVARGAPTSCAGDAHRARRRPVERADEVEQRRLARPGRPDDRRRARRSSTARSTPSRARTGGEPGYSFTTSSRTDDGTAGRHAGTTTSSPSATVAA